MFVRPKKEQCKSIYKVLTKLSLTSGSFALSQRTCFVCDGRIPRKSDKTGLGEVAVNIFM